MTTQVSPTTTSLQDLRQVVAIAVDRHPEQRGRIEHAAMIVALRSIVPDPTFADTMQVESEAEPGRFYSVDVGMWTCTCQDFQRRGIACKHQWSVKLLGALARLHSASERAVAARQAA